MKTNANINIVCLLKVDDDHATFTWSEGPASFESYRLEGQPFLTFKKTAGELRETLRLLAMCWLKKPELVPEHSLKLAQQGNKLYKRIFNPGSDQRDKARKILRWFEDLRDARPRLIETLEIVVEGSFSVPWNVIYDSEPDSELFLSDSDAGRHWKPFWGLRYNLAGGKKVDPRYRQPWLHDPSVLMVICPNIRSNLPEDQQKQLEDFENAHKEIQRVASKEQLISSLEDERPDVIYWLSHAPRPNVLELSKKTITAEELYELLSDNYEGDFGGLAFLNACQTVEESDAGSFFQTFRDVGFSGVVGTEQQTVDTFANPLGLELLERFLYEREPIGTILHKLRHRVPLGLLYGAYCPPNIRVVGEDEEEDSARVDAVNGLEGKLLGGQSDEQVMDPPGEDEREPPPPLPDKPYPSLSYYERSDRALFAGRDNDVERFGKLLDESSTRFLVLHGESGVGKSSFLRAGVIPFLEDDCKGYEFLRERDDPLAKDEESVFFVRATHDLVGQMADALCRYCARPYQYQTPSKEVISVDLPALLKHRVGAEPTPALVRSKLIESPALLGESLNAISVQLPFTLLLVVDQGEEIFTLPEDGDSRPASSSGRTPSTIIRRMTRTSSWAA